MTEGLVPVTVIGGYLGAGKTTVIAELLRAAAGVRLAVLVNDFGRLNLDAALLGPAARAAAEAGPLGAATPLDVVELTNGCVCCSLADALGDGLDAVLALDPKPDQIIIEASGVADPANIAAYGRGWPGVRLDAVVVVVDVTDIRRLVDDRLVGSTVRRQLLAADVLALSHLDTAAVDTAVADIALADSAAVRRLLTELAPGVPQVDLDHGVIEPAVLLDAGAAGLGLAGSRPGRQNSESGGGATFHTITVPLAHPVGRDELMALIEDWPDEVVRVKGVVAGVGDERWLVHRVGRRCTVEAAPRLDLPSSLVAIMVSAPGSVPPSPLDLGGESALGVDRLGPVP